LAHSSEVNAPRSWPICRANGLDGSGGRFAEQVLELGKDLFDRVQVGRIFRQEE